MDSDSYRQKEDVITSFLLAWEAEDILTPVSMIQFINIDDSYEHIKKIILSNKYSYYPVYKDGVDNILGVLHVVDLFQSESEKIDFHSILHYPLFISENKNVLEILKDFYNKKSSFAIVVDEHGSVRGIVTKQNILDLLWTSEESEETINEYIIDKKTHFTVDPRISLEEFNKKFSTNLESNQYDTIAGYIIEQFTYVPQLGESLVINNMEINISRIEGAKLLELMIKFN